MKTPQAMISYLEQLEKFAADAGVDLAKAYVEAGYARNAHWRHKTGTVALSLDAAWRIEAAIKRLMFNLN
jgi:hypothetical protein